MLDLIDILELLLYDEPFMALSFLEQDFSPLSASASGTLVITIVNSGRIKSSAKNFSLPFMIQLVKIQIKSLLRFAELLCVTLVVLYCIIHLLF